MTISRSYPIRSQNAAAMEHALQGYIDAGLTGRALDLAMEFEITLAKLLHSGVVIDDAEIARFVEAVRA